MKRDCVSKWRLNYHPLNQTFVAQVKLLMIQYHGVVPLNLQCIKERQKLLNCHWLFLNVWSLCLVT